MVLQLDGVRGQCPFSFCVGNKFPTVLKNYYIVCQKVVASVLFEVEPLEVNKTVKAHKIQLVFFSYKAHA